MIKKVIAYVSGYCFITIRPEARTLAADAVYKYGIRCYDAYVKPDGSYCLKIPLYAVGKATRGLEKEEIEYELSDVRGVPYYLCFLLRRPGLGVGLILFFVLMWLSGNTVWNIEIDGNEKYSDEFIINQLAELGFGYGTYIPSVDFDQMHAEYLARFPEISWISVNMSGTYAKVQLREKRLGGSDSHEGVYANIVASEDGVISHEETSAGVRFITQGDVVRKGELLVSGVVPLRNGGNRYTYAESKVFAYVPRRFEVEIPLKTVEKVYSGEQYSKKTVKFFKKSINLSINSRFEYTTYDKIVRNRRLTIFDTIPLPVWVDETEYREYYHVERTLSKEEAVTLAKKELRDKLDCILENAELASSNFSYEISENSFIIKCDLVCITDIAKVVEFTVDGSDTEPIE